MINADPTITPSAYEATSFACSGVETPSPTQTGVCTDSRIRETKSFADEETLVLVPVTPIKLAAYTNPEQADATWLSRSGAELGAATKMLFFKIEKEYWPHLKTFLIFLNYMPEKIVISKELSIIDSDISIDVEVAELLRTL